MKILKNIGFLFVIALTAFTVASCSDDDDDQVQTRLFRPVNIQLTTSENSITAKWTDMQGATGYYVELYTSENVTADDGEKYATKTLVASETNLQGASWTIAGLEFETTYYFRVKANSEVAEYDSRFSAFESTKTPAEIKVLTAEVLDATLGTVEFTWLEGFDLTYIVLDGPDGQQTITLTGGNAAGSQTVTGLSAGEYTAVAYNADRGFNVLDFSVPILLPMAGEDIRIDGVTFRWANIADLARIHVVNATDDTETYDYDISAVGTGELFVSNLGNFTRYNATIYFTDGTPGNTIEFTTLDAPAGTETVSTAAELKAKLASASNGSVIALNPGVYRFVSDVDGSLVGLDITKSVTIMSATAAMPVVQCKALSVKNTTDIDLIRLENIHWDADAANTGTYLFDIQSSIAGNIGSIEIVGCKITNLYNSVVRASRTAAFGPKNIKIDNCQMYNMNCKESFIGYTSGATSYSVESISVSNTTITNVGWDTIETRMFSLVGSDNMVFKLENNTITINSTAKNGTIHYRANSTGSTTGGKAEIKNNIIYIINNNPSGRYAKNCNFGSANPDIANNCLPTPFIEKLDPLTYDQWSNYGTVTADPKFANMAADDYTVGEYQLVTKSIGDPRWF